METVTKISIDQLKEMSLCMDEDLVKADIDVEKGIIMVDAPLHADMEAIMLENGSSGENLWGINLHPFNYGTADFIEFDSMINIKPRQNNRSRYVEDEKIRNKIISIIDQVVYE